MNPEEIVEAFNKRSGRIASDMLQKDTDKDVIVGLIWIEDYTCMYYWSVTNSMFTKLEYSDDAGDKITINFKTIKIGEKSPPNGYK